MQLLQLRIENFRCYENAKIDLDRSLLLITGRNDGGKTALLRAIELFLDGSEEPDPADFREDEKGDSADKATLTARIREEGTQMEVRRCFRRDGTEVNSSYEVKKRVPKDEDLREARSNFKDWLADDQREFLGSIGIPKEEYGSNQDERLRQLEEKIEDAPKTTIWVEESRLGLPDVNRSDSEEAGDPVRDVQKYLKKAVKDRINSVKEKETYSEIETSLEDEGEEQLDLLEEIFGAYDYGEEKSRLVPDLDVDLVKGLSLNALKVNQNGNLIPISKMGAARRRKLLLALEEWRLESIHEVEEPDPLVLLYDEPDMHFDYEAQRKLFRILRRLGERDPIQVVIATHSLNLIDSVAIDDIVYLDQERKGREVMAAHIQRLKNWDQIHDLARKLGLRNHIVLNACILCTEGETEEILIPELFHLDRGYTLPSIGVEMVRGDERGKDATWSLCKHVLRNNRKAFLVLDEDAKDPNSGREIDTDAIEEFNQEEGEELIEENRNAVFLGDKEVEDLFEDRTIAAAYEKYLASMGESLDNDVEAITIVANARDSEGSLMNQLKADMHTRTETGLSKPKLAEHLIEMIRTDSQTHPIPIEIENTFNLLETYVNGDRTG
ncbi:putative ATP-dependent endonuclease of OLD family [Salinibacter ruber]|uniref:ATP-dependent nuclease n=1 Tax=Salinibacter ruber TaxID=146919 RepID=UPI00216980B1|nr:putative ATP-dependent endonuclease of OLD family [Salinibacter ruber]